MERYKIPLMVIDESGTAILTLFDRDCTKYIGITAKQLRKSLPQVCSVYTKLSNIDRVTVVLNA